MPSKADHLSESHLHVWFCYHEEEKIMPVTNGSLSRRAGEGTTFMYYGNTHPKTCRQECYFINCNKFCFTYPKKIA